MLLFLAKSLLLVFFINSDGPFHVFGVPLVDRVLSIRFNDIFLAVKMGRHGDMVHERIIPSAHVEYPGHQQRNLDHLVVVVEAQRYFRN